MPRWPSLAVLGRSLPLAVPVFAAAWLLFWVEPMLGKLLLPALGGTPATWAACLLAFQLLLLVGYGYVWIGARLLTVRAQALVHLLLVTVALGLQLGEHLSAPVELGALPAVLAVPAWIARRVGLPFVVLASTTPLVARFASALGRPSSGIYGVSNLGALCGLLAYPWLFERLITLPVQLALWAAGFMLLGLSWLALGVAVARQAVAEPPARPSALAWRCRLRWLALAAVPSALLVAVTNYVTVDVAAAPLLWVLPLALYLLSFVVTFSGWRARAVAPALVMWLVGSAWLSFNALAQGAAWLPSQLASALLALCGGAVLCHAELGRELPPGPNSSGFYALLALGGALGGGAVSLLAPLVFSDFYELELASVGVFWFLLPLLRRRARVVALPRALRLAAMLGVGVCLPLLVGEVAVRQQASASGGRIIERRRSFLGPLKVVDVAGGRVLTHGRIQHGMQLRAPEQRRTPTMYFGSGTAIARVLDTAPAEPRRLGVVGLGVGTLASYGRPGESLRFYELDRNVIELAQRHFSFLESSLASVTVVEGDGRLSLAREAPHAFDVLVLDAFSSDSVPMHLLTREAFEIYEQQLAPDGLILANVSNRHLAVERVVCGSASAIGFACQVVETPTRASSYVTHVAWAVLARDPARLASALGEMSRSSSKPGALLWTDSRARLLSLLR